MSTVHRDFRDIVVELIRHEARFLIVGAHALAAHGVPRATADLDIWIEPTEGNAERVWRALAAFGAPVESLGLTKAELSRPDIVAQLGLPPVRIDLMTGLSGVRFADAWQNRVEAEFDGVRAPFLGRSDLVVNKRATGRTRDLADLESLGER
ncbi:MAG: hypothetical protein KF709_12815 [Gemmatimonadaceae bacterium]|nr:hypothetical protein [Gemmatimonadaceae bacterium]